MELHDTLNPLLWDHDRLRPVVLRKIKQIGSLWLDFVKIQNSYVDDIVFTGSNANYNYTKYSDIDIHYIVDKNKLRCNKFIDDYLLDKKRLFSENYDLKIFGYSVEMYVQDQGESMPKNQGIFSIKNNEWIIKPHKIELDIDDDLVLKKTKHILKRITSVLRLNNIESLQKLKEKLRNYRKSGLQHNGEYSLENLVYKNLRNMEVLQFIDDKINDLIHKKYSI
jgi:predicted nucleotidyltransferase